MIDFFQPTATDKSLEYLSAIFGNVNGVIPGSGGTITLLGTMFTTFNSVALVVGALIVVYMTVMGVIMTAHEGEFMKKWHSLWTPLRAVIGIAALVPTTSGFCGLQIIMMWVVVQGIGAADNIWNTALSYISIVGSPYAQVSMSNPGVPMVLGNLFQATVCEQSARATYAAPYQTETKAGAYYCGPDGSSTDAFCSATITDDLAALQSPSYTFGPQGACGNLTFCNQKTLCSSNDADKVLACQTCKAQISTLSAIIKMFRNTADMLVKADYDYQNYWDNGYLVPDTIPVATTTSDQPIANPNAPIPAWVTQYCQDNAIATDKCRGPVALPGGDKLPAGLPDPNSGQSSVCTITDASDTTKNQACSTVTNAYWKYVLQPALNEDFMASTINYYNNSIGLVVTQYLAQLQQQSPIINSRFRSAQQDGWIFAGAYYYKITMGNKGILSGSLPALTVTAPTLNALGNNARNNVNTALTLIDIMQGRESGSQSSLNQTQQVMNNGGAAVSQAFSSIVKPGGATDPLAQLAATGYGLITAAGILYTIALVLIIVLGTVSAINAWGLGTGLFNPLVGGWSAVATMFIPLFLSLLAYMISIGGLLGVYVPLIPYIVFTVGAIGWMIATIEMMTAGPLVALGILAPGGHSEILGKAEPALLLLFNIFLRPSLMVFGLIAAMLLASVTLKMINYMFWTMVSQLGTAAVGSGGALKANIIESIIFLIAYVLLIVTALNKCFELIHILPDRVIVWIGGHPGAGAGEAAALGEMKGGIASGAGAAGGKMAALSGSAMSGAGTGREKRKEEADAASKAAKANDATIKSDSAAADVGDSSSQQNTSGGAGVSTGHNNPDSEA